MRTCINSIVGIGMVFGTASFGGVTSHTVSVTANVLPGPTSLSVTPDTCGFGAVTAMEADHRFVATNDITVSYFAANGPWGISIYTTNDPIVGLVSTNGTDSMLLKFSRPYPTDNVTFDPELDPQWGGISWTFVLHQSNALALVSDDEDAAATFDFSLGIEAAGAVLGAHESDVIIELTFP